MKKSIAILLLVVSCGKNANLRTQISESGVIVNNLNWKDLKRQTDNTPFAINSRAVGLIKSIRRELCTGFLINKDMVMTNEHCIPNAQAAKGLTITFGYDAFAAQADKITYQCEKFIMANQKLDFAIIKCLPENGEFPGDRFGMVTLESRFDFEFGDIYLIQQNCTHYLNRYCDPSKKIAYGKIFDKENGEFIHDADTLEGSSGSPVFSKDNHRVVALHHTGVGLGNIAGEYNMAVPMWAITSFIENNRD